MVVVSGGGAMRVRWDASHRPIAAQSKDSVDSARDIRSKRSHLVAPRPRAARRVGSVEGPGPSTNRGVEKASERWAAASSTTALDFDRRIAAVDLTSDVEAWHVVGVVVVH